MQVANILVLEDGKVSFFIGTLLMVREAQIPLSPNKLRNPLIPINFLIMILLSLTLHVEHDQ
jgi:hypothetical protein